MKFEYICRVCDDQNPCRLISVFPALSENSPLHCPFSQAAFSSWISVWVSTSDGDE
jgi:hypothetical protein